MVPFLPPTKDCEEGVRGIGTLVVGAVYFYKEFFSAVQARSFFRVLRLIIEFEFSLSKAS